MGDGTLMPQEPIPGPGMKRVATVLNNPEYASVKAYAKRKGLSIYALVKKALREYVERHP